MDRKKQAILERINHLEEAMAKAQEYVENGRHAHWAGFRPLFVAKVSNGKEQPPHRDWVRNVFLPRVKKALDRAEKTLDRLSP